MEQNKKKTSSAPAANTQRNSTHNPQNKTTVSTSNKNAKQDGKKTSTTGVLFLIGKTLSIFLLIVRLLIFSFYLPSFIIS